MEFIKSTQNTLIKRISALKDGKARRTEAMFVAEGVRIVEDANMLLSIINTKLRDDYSSLDDLVCSENLDKQVIIEKLKSIGYEYSESQNKFI